jgi:hypothetical protein
MTWQPDLWSYGESCAMKAPNGTKFRVTVEHDGVSPLIKTEPETHRRPTQAGRILAYLRAGNRITALDALESFGCFRLAARIHELRREGWAIEERTVETRGGKRVAEYSL